MAKEPRDSLIDQNNSVQSKNVYDWLVDMSAGESDMCNLTHLEGIQSQHFGESITVLNGLD